MLGPFPEKFPADSLIVPTCYDPGSGGLVQNKKKYMLMDMKKKTPLTNEKWDYFLAALTDERWLMNYKQVHRGRNKRKLYTVSQEWR